MQPTQEQLIAYFSGKTSAEEKRLIEVWLASQRDARQLRLIGESIRLVMEAMPDPYADPAHIPQRTLRAHERFQELIRAERGVKESGAIGYRGGKLRHILRYAIGVAAVLLLILAGTSLYNRYTGASSRKDIAAIPKDTVFYAAKAAITRITLADSSVVRLFPGSTLTVNAAYNIQDRQVAINGRGYFEVRHDAGKPFYVKAGRITTTVVGTAFEMNTSDTAVAAVIVKEGKVNVSSGRTPLSSLTHDRRITIDKFSGAFTVQSVDATAQCGWIRGEIDFLQAPLQEILHTLAPWYGVSFVIRRPVLQHKKITFFIRRQDLKESMDILAAAGGFRYRIEQHQVLIY
jgi:ferric-dicitrate binding protein FerR (iron transport regulator)